jgi:UDP-GlcNAc:undecaprenyl-phosphate GlcNAc-1-phosphate transferase
MKIENTYLIFFVLSFSIGLITSFIAIPKIILWAKKRNKMDVPNWRSSHKTPIASYGGICFSISIFICSMLFVSSSRVTLFMLCLSAISILGFMDDLLNLKATKKFAFQIIIATIIYVSGFQITSLHQFLDVGEIPSIISYLITVILIVGITNAFNLIDGVDGLAGGIGVISSITFTAIFISHGKYHLAILSLALTGSLMGFLKYNFSPAKIFMGDSGSLLIGLALSVFFIETWSLNDSTSISASACTLLIPCLDMLRLFISRIVNKTSPFKADNNHYHHLLIKAGDSHKKVSITVFIITFLLLGIGVVLNQFYNLRSSLLMAFLFSISSYIYIEIRFYLLSKKKDRSIQNSILQIVGQNNLLNQKL